MFNDINIIFIIKTSDYLPDMLDMRVNNVQTI